MCIYTFIDSCSVSEYRHDGALQSHFYPDDGRQRENERERERESQTKWERKRERAREKKRERERVVSWTMSGVVWPMQVESGMTDNWLPRRWRVAWGPRRGYHGKHGWIITRVRMGYPSYTRPTIASYGWFTCGPFPKFPEACCAGWLLLFFFITLDLELSDTKVYEP